MIAPISNTLYPYMPRHLYKRICTRAHGRKCFEQGETGRYAASPILQSAIEGNQWTIRQALEVLRQIMPYSQLSFENMYNMSWAWLPYEERHIISFLIRNPDVFQRVVALSSQHPEQPAWFATTPLVALREFGKMGNIQTHDGKLVTHIDVELGAFTEFQERKEIESLLRKLQEQWPLSAPVNTQPIMGESEPFVFPFAALAWLGKNPLVIDQLGLTPIEQKQLHALLQPTVLRFIEGLVQGYQLLLSPDFIRVLVSLLFNPQLHRPGGILPLSVFEHGIELEKEPEVLSIDPVDETENDFLSEGVLHKPRKLWKPLQKIRLSVHEIRDLCRHLKGHGGVLLSELQAYCPCDSHEASVLQCLRQNNIFHALADLNGINETLEPSDLASAVEKGTITLIEENIQLVIGT